MSIERGMAAFRKMRAGTLGGQSKVATPVVTSVRHRSVNTAAPTPTPPVAQPCPTAFADALTLEATITGSYTNIAAGGPATPLYIGSANLAPTNGEVWELAVPGFAASVLSSTLTESPIIAYDGGFIYVYTSGGIFRVDASTGTAVRWDTLGGSFSSEAGGGTRIGITVTDTGGVWISNLDGNLVEFDSAGNHVGTYFSPTFVGLEGLAFSATHGMIYGGDSAGDIWQVNPATAAFTLLETVAQGWTDTAYRNGRVWVSSSSGSPGDACVGSVAVDGSDYRLDVELDGLAQGLRFITWIGATMYGTRTAGSDTEIYSFQECA